MGSRDRRHWVVFGAGDKPNKSLIAYPSKSMNGWAVKICELEQNICEYEYGHIDKPTAEQILDENTREYTTVKRSYCHTQDSAM